MGQRLLAELAPGVGVRFWNCEDPLRFSLVGQGRVRALAQRSPSHYRVDTNAEDFDWWQAASGGTRWDPLPGNRQEV
jgi:hypothetical protein